MSHTCPARLALTGAALTGLLLACSSSSSSPSSAASSGDATVVDDAAAPPDTGAADAAVEAAVDASKPTGKCADTFGAALTTGFGRIDGIVYAVQKPSDTACVLPNADHVVLQVLMNGAVYRLVANVQSDRAGADPKIRVALFPHALPAPAFAEGWHAGAVLDYVMTLGAHSDASFTALTLADATTKIATSVNVGDPVSVYGTCGAGRPESAHLIHRNAADQDGAIIVNPTTAPEFLLFHFDNQTF